MKQLRIAALLLMIPMGFLIWFIYSKTEDAPLRYLPYFGPKNYSGQEDTTYHIVPAFSFTDQDGNTFSSKHTGGKIYVAEYFFTTCKSICPVMNMNLEHLYKKFGSRNDFLILSHTVDPETDSVPQLKAYANGHGVHNKAWVFVTGSKKDLYEQARKGYLLDASEGNGGEEDFVHTQNFALVDKDRHIRGFYDGTDSVEMRRLEQDLNVLFKEYEFREKQAQNPN